MRCALELFICNAFVVACRSSKIKYSVSILLSATLSNGPVFEVIDTAIKGGDLKQAYQLTLIVESRQTA